MNQLSDSSTGSSVQEYCGSTVGEESRSPRSILMAVGVLLSLGVACASGSRVPADGSDGRGTGAGALGGGSAASSGAGGTRAQAGAGGTMPSSGGNGSGGVAGGSAGAGGGAPSGTGGSCFDGRSRLVGLPETSCTVTVNGSEVSPYIATVGIVSFSSNLAGLTAAEIHFGPSTDYGLVAPVDLEEAGHRTLLLGMAQNRIYHFRVAVSDGRSVCYGEDTAIETGSLHSKALAEASTGDGAASGFIVTARDWEAVIFNKQGELVWAYKMWNLFSVQMSWDGKYMVGRDPGPFDLSDSGLFYRVRMDGSDFTSIDAPGGDHHDFAVTPWGIAYIAKVNEGECDRVFEASIEIADGVPIFDTWQIYQYFPDEGDVEGTEICHVNRIHYSLEKDTYTLSDRNKDAIAVFTRSGTPITSIGKAPTGNWTQHIAAEGAGLGGDWHVQHGHHFYADDKLVVFSNESSGGAAVLHYTIIGNQAALDWKYDGAGESKICGDVQHLPNGNFLVTANLSNLMVELGPDGRTEVGRYVLGGPIGPLYGFTYSTHRPSLYGTPPPR
jgi:hypothetical protein